MPVVEALDARRLRPLLETVLQPALRAPSCRVLAAGCDAEASCGEPFEHGERVCGGLLYVVVWHDARSDAQHGRPMRQLGWRDVHRQAY